MSTTPSDHWLGRLMATFPSPRWTADRAQAYVDACAGVPVNYCARAINRVQREWTDSFAPTAPQFRQMADAERTAAVASRNRELDGRKRTEEVKSIAAPWHAKLWCAVWWRLQRLSPPVGLGLHPYLEIVDRYRITPETAGVVFEPGGMMTIDHARRDAALDEAISAAEMQYRASGLNEDPVEANRAALAVMAGATTDD